MSWEAQQRPRVQIPPGPLHSTPLRGFPNFKSKARTEARWMSPSSETRERFDRIADIYDETREPLTDRALDGAASILAGDGVGQILEVGIGTGRIGRPLQERGFQMTGVDLSRGMLSKARRKGLDNLIMGDANRLPFANRAFDAVVLAHVLHLLQNPRETFVGLSSVARVEIVAFVRRRDLSSDGPSTTDDQRGALRQTFRKFAEEMGYQLPALQSPWRDRFKIEYEFLSSSPPDELITLEDVTEVTTLGERISYFERHAYGYPSPLPEEAFRIVMERVKSSIDPNKEVRSRRVEQMAVWRLSR